MGNRSTSLSDDSSSSTPPLLPKDLFALTDQQLCLLWDHHPILGPELLQAARPLKAKKTVQADGFYHDPKNQNDSETPESALAIRLHRLVPSLAKLRFQLVPSSGIKEEVFWQATMMLLKERLVEYNAAISFDDDDMITRQEVEEVKETLLKTQRDNKAKTKTKTIPNKTTGVTSATVGGKPDHDDLLRQLKAKEKQIADLQRQVKELLQQQQQQAKHNDKAQSGKPHKGSWNMDKDSLEFLQYPEEVKESLRKEKQRRMQQVMDEMKFILDSDHMKDSNGKWSCCGSTDYKASCCK